MHTHHGCFTYPAARTHARTPRPAHAPAHTRWTRSDHLPRPDLGVRPDVGRGQERQPTGACPSASSRPRSLSGPFISFLPCCALLSSARPRRRYRAPAHRRIARRPAAPACALPSCPAPPDRGVPAQGRSGLPTTACRGLSRSCCRACLHGVARRGAACSAHAARELRGDVVPDVVRPALEHARAGHEVQAVARGVRVGPQERGAVDRQEVHVGVPARLERRLRAGGRDVRTVSDACARAEWETQRQRAGMGKGALTSNARL